jgi:carbohydrate-binding DOMON domain-containing protein
MCVRVCVCVCVCVRVRVPMFYKFESNCFYSYPPLCTHIMPIKSHLYTQAHTHTRTHTRTYIYTHTHTHTHTHAGQLLVERYNIDLYFDVMETPNWFNHQSDENRVA